jgi:tRNA pseudouridine55 synthase
MDSELLSGFLLIDKPKDITSFDVIRKLRKQTGIRTFGHAGTLDPFATGLLIIAVNKYTRLLALLDNAEKEYTATMVLGTATSTGDPEGDIIQTIVRQITLDEIEMATQKVLNIQALKPPLHSAIKVNGKKAYERARADEDFELPERASAIFSFTVDKFEFPCLTFMQSFQRYLYPQPESMDCRNSWHGCLYKRITENSHRQRFCPKSFSIIGDNGYNFQQSCNNCA